MPSNFNLLNGSSIYSQKDQRTKNLRKESGGFCYAKSKSSLDLLDHGSVFFLGQVGLAGVHGEGSAPLELALVLGNQMEVQMAAAVAVSAVVDLVGGESLVDGVCCGGNVLEEQSALFGGDVDQLGDMILVGHDDTAGMALLLEQDQLRDLQVTDLDAEAGQNFAAHAVTAVAIFHRNYLFR